MTVDENYHAKQQSRVVRICAPNDNVNRIGKFSGPKRFITGAFLSVYLHIWPHFHFASQDGPFKAPSDPAQQPITIRRSVVYNQNLVRNIGITDKIFMIVFFQVLIA